MGPLHEHMLLMLGDQGVGKRHITLRFGYSQWGFGEYDPTDDFDYQRRLRVEQLIPRIRIDHCPYTTTPRNVELCLKSPFYDGAFVVYSVTSRTSFENVRGYVEEVAAAKKKTNTDRFVLLIVGNKSDCIAEERQVSTAEGKALAVSLGIGFAEVSAKTNENIDEAFRQFVLDVWEQYPERKEDSSKENIHSDIIGMMERYNARMQAKMPAPSKGGLHWLQQLWKKSKMAR